MAQPRDFYSFELDLHQIGPKAILKNWPPSVKAYIKQDRQCYLTLQLLTAKFKASLSESETVCNFRQE